MTYSVYVADDGSHIVLKFVGVSGSTQLQGVLEAHRLGAARGIRRFLVDLTEATNPGSPLDDYQLAYVDFPLHPEIDRHAKVVALTRPGDHSHDFLVTVFRNSGAYLELFDDAAAALEALKDGRPTSRPSPSAVRPG